MIVVVGSPLAQPVRPGIGAGGIVADVARAIAASGALVQVVGRVGDDAAGDQVLLALAAAGVGHVAVLREAGQLTPAALPEPGESPGPDGPAIGESLFEDGDPDGGREATPPPAGLSLDAADLELALRYVPDYRVLVLATDLDGPALDAAVAAAGWSGAHLVALMPDGASTAALPEAATVLLRPPTDPDGAFGAMVAGFAVALDGGAEPAAAFATAQRAGGWAAVSG